MQNKLLLYWRGGKVKYRRFVLLSAILLTIFVALFYVTSTLAQSPGEPEIIYYNTLDGRTPVSDNYLIKTTDYGNGTILRTYETQIYNHPVNILDNGEYKPFTEVANLSWDDISESFILSWQGREIRIKPFVVDNQNNEYTISQIKTIYPEIVFAHNIARTRKYRYGISFSNLSQEFQQNIANIRFSFEGLQGLSLNDIRSDEESVILGDTIDVYFDRGLTSDFGFNVDGRGLSVGNVANMSEIVVDMIMGLT